MTGFVKSIQIAQELKSILLQNIIIYNITDGTLWGGAVGRAVSWWIAEGGLYLTLGHRQQCCVFSM